MIEFVKPEDLLAELRWTADRIITNPFGDRVWLKQIKDGLTDCCFADEPCEYHAKLIHPAPARRN